MILKIESDHKWQLVKWFRNQAGLRYPSKTTSNCIFLTGRGFQPPKQEQWFQQPWVTRLKSQYGRKYTCKYWQTWNNFRQKFPRHNNYYRECCLWSQVTIWFWLFGSRCCSHLIIDYWLLIIVTTWFFVTFHEGRSWSLSSLPPCNIRCKNPNIWLKQCNCNYCKGKFKKKKGPDS